MNSTRVSLVRHGQVHNPQKVYYGRLPRFRLSRQGRSQALSVAHFLAGQQVTAVYSSPLLRARQTAIIIANLLRLPLHISRLLIEVHSPHDGRPQVEMERRQWDLYGGSPSEYEQPAEVVQRVTRFIRRVRRQHGGRHVVAVTHADPIAWTVLWAAGQPLAVPAQKHLQRVGLPVDYPAVGSVTTLVFSDGEERPQSVSYRGVEDNAGTNISF